RLEERRMAQSRPFLRRFCSVNEAHPGGLRKIAPIRQERRWSSSIVFGRCESNRGQRHGAPYRNRPHTSTTGWYRRAHGPGRGAPVFWRSDYRRNGKVFGGVANYSSPRLEIREGLVAPRTWKDDNA